MKSILELINEIKSQNLPYDEILEKYDEMINIEKFYLGMINSERNSREEIEKERNLALVDENFRNNYSLYCKNKNMQNDVSNHTERMYNENQQPEMRLYGVDENYFKSIDELLKYCRQNKLSTQRLTVLDYYRHFGNFNDVIRKITSESSMFYAVPNERGICWYSDELNHNTENWEFNHGTIRDLYKPFRDYGVVFEDDIYAKEDEKNQNVLKFYKENNLFNMGNK